MSDINRHALGPKINTNGGLGLLFKLIRSEAKLEVCFPDAHVANDNH